MTDKLTRAGQRDVWLAVVAFCIAFVLWQMQGLFFLTYPLRLFVTMIHELGHGLAAVLTGGSFLRFEVTRRGAGLAYTSGGSRFVVIQAGYLGTALFGAALLFLTHRTSRPQRVAVGVGLFVGILTLLYSGISLANLNLLELIIGVAVVAAGGYVLLTRDTGDGHHLVGAAIMAGGALLLLFFAGGGNTLTILVGLASALILVVIGLYASRDVVIVTLTFLAFLTGLQAITDAWVLLKIVSLPHSMMPLNDASSMASAAGGSAALWAIFWIVLDVLIFGTAVYGTLIRPYRHNSGSPTLRSH